MTPLHIKHDELVVWPQNDLFYILAKDGLFKCRNHPFFKSCVNITRNANLEELLEQEEFCDPRYPKIPAQFLEDTWAFFREIARRHQAEAIVLIGYNTKEHLVVPIIPDQESGGMHLTYKDPRSMPENTILIGDIHSHVDAAAFHSGTDIADEKKRAGLHITFGKVRGNYPDISIEIVVDGERFKVRNHGDVLEDFVKPGLAHPEWLAQFAYKPFRHYGDDCGWDGGHTWEQQLNNHMGKFKKNKKRSRIWEFLKS